MHKMVDTRFRLIMMCCLLMACQAFLVDAAYGIDEDAYVVIDVSGGPEASKWPVSDLASAPKKPSLSTKMGRILSLKSTARKRFGANTCLYLEGASPDGRVRILLLGCKEDRERRDITPQTMQ